MRRSNTMREVVVENLRQRLGFYADLAAQVDDETIAAELGVAKHRSLGMHLWCVVGTRESFAKAIAAGEMRGWACSVGNFSQGEFVAKLAESAQTLLASIDRVTEWTLERDRLLAEVAEHEVMHEGQIIRVMFGLEKPLPESCHWAVCD